MYRLFWKFVTNVVRMPLILGIAFSMDWPIICSSFEYLFLLKLRFLKMILINIPLFCNWVAIINAASDSQLLRRRSVADCRWSKFSSRDNSNVKCDEVNQNKIARSRFQRYLKLGKIFSIYCMISTKLFQLFWTAPFPVFWKLFSEKSLETNKKTIAFSLSQYANCFSENVTFDEDCKRRVQGCVRL